ncbi:hypothetical protein JTB14_020741 [Gonioctena quinquepunctata]|nr:hypothetical protein JTB14_020741 [Gonioctena quinquepunctata]
MGRKIGPIIFNVQGKEVKPCGAIKYLGVWLDTKLTFAEHINKTIDKVEKTASALGSLMPNVGGPRAPKRLILASVVHLQLLYAAPVWHTVTANKKLTQRLIRVQRQMCLRVCSAYRTREWE